MAELYGWAGTILNVDLTQGKIEKEQLSPEFAEKYIGGIGFNAVKLFDLVRPKIDALSPENVMIFGVGPLAGTLYPGNTRLTVTAKSPLTDVFGSANIGGFFGAEMKYAGYDQIIFSGKSEKPVYLWIDDDEVELRDASHLWGTSSWEAGMRLKEEIGDPELQVLTIGQAGENMVRFANIQNPPRGAAGRIGMGAVMGSKNLKAVAVRGSKAVKVARPDEFFNICRESTLLGRSEPRYEALRGGGSPHWLDYLVTMGATGARNFQKPEFPNWKAIAGENFRAGGEFTVRKRACFSCPIGCSGFFNIRSGEFEQTFGRTPEFGLTMIGLFCDFTDIPAMLKMQSLFDEYGMDVLSGGGIFSWAMDCYSKGLLSKEDCDGISLEWGNYNAIIELIPKIAKREGVGNLLAEGEKRAPQKLGRGSEKLMYDVKGVIGGIQDPRVSKLFGFAYRTANRGGDHLTANVTWIPDLVRDSELEKEAFGDFLIRWGGTQKRDVAMEGMGAMVKVCEDITAIINAAETCVRTGGSFELIGKGLSAATGLEFSIEKMLLTGERIFNVEKAFNAREGLTRKEDDFSAPEKFAEPVPEGPYKGAIFSDLNDRLDEYYRSRGWDEKTSLQTTAKLKELELDDVAQELKKVNAIK
jgi:aldehyde:ferredoxin oxidoreductase